MMLARHAQLGMIPSYVYSNDPKINPRINPHVVFPPGWTQSTIQPVGPVLKTPPGFEGLGTIFDSWAWNNRKWLVLGGVGLLGLAALGVVGSILR